MYVTAFPALFGACANISLQNILNPQLGAAKTPYAKSIRTEQKLNAARPDPGVLFDCMWPTMNYHTGIPQLIMAQR